MLGWIDLSHYNFHVVILLEPIQLKWMVKYKDQQSLGLRLHHYPYVIWILKHKAPSLCKTFKELETSYQILPDNTTLKDIESAFIQSLEDWIIYVTDLNIYDQLSFNNWDDQALLSLTDFKGKTIVDIGSGTGSQLFRMTPNAKNAYGVEPIGHLRTYLKEKAPSLELTHVYIVDGLLTEIPFHDHFSDITVTGHVFGDLPEEELDELERITKPGGTIILMPGNDDRDNEVHSFLLKNGFKYDRFFESGPSPSHGWKRKYWKTM
ncbi:MAG: methyltransferase domain-containing protein [Candidatus Izemoplasma sp.]|nr:methyltransferase domain-containing protein [Candidatus Izemoplasma sp.]